MADAPSALYPNVPTLKAATGSNWTMAAWRGIAAPKGSARRRATSSSPRSRRSSTARTTPTSWRSAASASIYAPPEDFAKFMAKSDADLGATMKAVGIVK